MRRLRDINGVMGVRYREGETEACVVAKSIILSRVSRTYISFVH